MKLSRACVSPGLNGVGMSKPGFDGQLRPREIQPVELRRVHADLSVLHVEHNCSFAI